MKKLILTTALACALGAPAYAGNIDVTGNSEPDGDAWNDVTTLGYSYYTGPIILDVAPNSTLEVYCGDLEHNLANATYTYVPLMFNGAGAPISQFTSEKIGLLANLGFAQDLSTLAGQDKAAAVQAEIWDLEYNTTSSFTNAGIQSAWNGLQTTVASYVDVKNEYALAIDPVGEGWPGASEGEASQQMVVGVTSVPEPSTWAMGLIGFGLLGGVAFARRRDSLSMV